MPASVEAKTATSVALLPLSAATEVHAGEDDREDDRGQYQELGKLDVHVRPGNKRQCRVMQIQRRKKISAFSANSAVNRTAEAH
jgi:hypothetical protein